MKINPTSMLPFFHPDYEAPSPDDIRLLLAEQGLTGARAAAMVGVDSRTVRRWTSNTSGRSIPYAAWRLLLIHSGRADR